MTDADAAKPRQRLQILVCDGPSCGVSFESETLKEWLTARIAADPDLQGRVHVADYMCFGRCSEGPNMFVRKLEAGERGDEEPDSTVFGRERGFYPGMDERKCDQMLIGHCLKGVPVDGLVDDY